MDKFIEVSENGRKVLINTNQIFKIVSNNHGCIIYFAVSKNNTIGAQDIKCDDSYHNLVAMIQDYRI